MKQYIKRPTWTTELLAEKKLLVVEVMTETHDAIRKLLI